MSRQIGNLSDDCEELLSLHKELGFKNATQMIDFGLKLLKLHIKKQKRKTARKKMLDSYSLSNPENIFESIEGDPFND